MAFSFLLFLLSVFTYENTALLFPALLLFSWPLRAEQTKQKNQKDVKKYGLLALAGILCGLLPYFTYRLIGYLNGRPLATPTMGTEIGLDTLGDALTVTISVLLNFADPQNLGNTPWALVATGIFVIAAILGTYTFIRIFRKQEPADQNSEERLRFLILFAGCVWLLLVGTVPYGIAGYGVTSRVYSAAIFGLFPLLLLIYDLGKNALVRSLVLLCIVLSFVLGFAEMGARHAQVNHPGRDLTSFYLGLKQVVPFVKSETVFILIDFPLSESGCGPSMEMLYGQIDLLCAFLSSTNPEYRAIRYPTYLAAERGGNLRTENWILIRVDEAGTPQIVDELNPGDLDLFITWQDQSPIRTDFRRIEPASSHVTQFYEYLLRQAQE
ncbi:MAG: hypothetical protein WEA61_04835 [Anaerolineales bacterium]